MTAIPVRRADLRDVVENVVDNFRRDRLMTAAAAIAYQVISAVIPPPRLPPEHLDPADLIEQLASATGGRRLMEARLPGSAAALVAQIMEQMRK